MDSHRFWLAAAPPFRLDLTVWALRRRRDNAIDRWDGETYRRVLPLADGLVEFAVRQAGSAERARIEVCLRGPNVRASTKPQVARALERLLGLRIDMTDFYRFAASQRRLGRLAARFRGMKPPRFPTVFEALVNAIACQQVTLSLGILLLNKLAVRCAPSLDEGGANAFPRPVDLANRRVEDFRRLGFSRQKGRAMIELASSLALGPADLEALAGETDETAIEQLLALRGIGRWSAEYALLRGLGRTHIFPGDDVGARNRLQKLLELPQQLDYAAVERRLRRWRPYAGLVYFHLLLDGLADAGRLEESAGTRNSAMV